MTRNQDSAHLCRKCMTPISSHATIDPIFGISARGDTFSKAASTPRKPIVLVGMWLLFGPVAMIFSLGALGTRGPAGLVLAACALLPIAILWKTTANYLKGPPPRERSGFTVVEDDKEEPSAEQEVSTDDVPNPLDHDEPDRP